MAKSTSQASSGLIDTKRLFKTSYNLIEKHVYNMILLVV